MPMKSCIVLLSGRSERGIKNSFNVCTSARNYLTFILGFLSALITVKCGKYVGGPGIDFNFGVENSFA